MIYFVSPANDSFEMGEYLLQDGRPLQSLLQMLSYEKIVSQRQLPLGSYIFSAIDQLSPTLREIAARCHRALSQASKEITVLNHPGEVVCRYELLEECFQTRRNSFRVFRAPDFYRCTKFPVFLRMEREHTGSLTDLIYDRRQLVKAIAKAVVNGYRARDMMIVEYCNTADSSGVFRKYSTYIVGNTIIPNSIVHSSNWVTKWNAKVSDPDALREELDYAKTNPHENWLREVFALARISYGRIDYGMQDSVPQIWEINTNPTISRRLGNDDPARAEVRKLRAPVRQLFFPRLQNALASLDSSEASGRGIPIEISPREARRIEAEKLTTQRLRAQRDFYSQRGSLTARILRRFTMSAPAVRP
jgi:hypothetical protein